MAKSLLEQLPEIVRNGKRQAEQILEQLEGPQRVALQTREFVIPNRQTTGLDVRLGGAELPADPNRLIYGDNLLAMAALLAGDEAKGMPSYRGKVDLIYIDPPFDSKADYRTKLQLAGLDVEQRPTTAEQFAYSDTWERGTASYLEMIVPRLVLLREMLASSGSMYVHVGTQVNHYVRIAADAIFGKDNFVEEVVWAYGSPSGGRAAGTKLVKIHEYVLHYAYDYPSRYEAKIHLPYSDKYVKDWFKYTDEHGRQYQRRSRGQGVWEKQYLDESEGVPASTVWTDLRQVYADPRAYKADQALHSEITGYATQKPEKLLERIILHTCPPGGLVADFFSGSGTTAAVAERLGRRWLTSDLGKPAVMITRKRLIDKEATPFLYQAIGDYQVEQARSTLGRRFRTGDLAQTVLGIFEALPLPPEHSLGGTLGRLPSESTLVYADSPARQVTLSTLKRAQQLRDTVMGGFDKVIVLGWNFTAGIGQQIAELNDSRLDVKVIPPDLLDQLKKKGESGLAGRITFSTLQYLRATVTGRYPRGDDQEDLNVRLDDYVLLSPDAISIRAEDRPAIRELANREPLALLEYWAVDPDYDGEIFRSVWQNYRGNTLDDGDPLRVGTSATITTDRKDGSRTVCVRAVDVFGFESEDVIHVSEAQG